MRYVFIDFETRSEAEIKKTGAECYARHPSTRPLMLSFAFDEDQPELIFDFEDPPIWWTFPDIVFVAHNAPFERAIITNCLPHWGLPENWLCTASMSRAAGLPGDLDGAANALNLPVKKNKRGKALIKLFCTLQKATKKSGRSEPYFMPAEERPEEWEEFCYYCNTDVAAMRELFWAIGPEILTPAEHAAMIRNWRSNEQGIAIDIDTLNGAIDLIKSQEKRACKMLEGITDGEVTTPNQTKKIASFCGLPSIGANEVIEALKDPYIDAESAAVLRIRQDVGRSSVKKTFALADCLSGGRVRDLTIHYGAHTGRETGKRAQPLNMPRGNFKGNAKQRYEALEDTLRLVRERDAITLRARYGSVLGAVSSCLRGLFIASPGNEFFCADMAAIEARLVFWFAGELQALQCYREGIDNYKVLATVIYNKALEEITKEEREIGKRGVLGLGFGMGEDRFVGMVYEQSRLHIPLSLARKAKSAYRTKYFRVPKLWKGIENAAKHAVSSKERFTYGKISYHMDRKWLVCTLPSGREMRYYDPKIDEDLQLTHMALETFKGSRKWKRVYTYGGKLTENFVQALARDILQVFMDRIERAGYSITLTVYDEILCEKPKGTGSLEEIIEIMSTAPDWAHDLPLAAEGWQGERYRK